MSKKITASLLLLICVSSVAYLQTGEVKQVRSQFANAHIGAASNLQQRLSAVENMPSLGFRNLLADSVFLSFLQYFSDVSDGNNVDENLSPLFFESIISLDPFYRNYYLFLSSSTTLYAAQPQKTIEIMDRGLEKIDPGTMPDSFYIWRYKAVDELLFLGDSQSARKSFEKAAEWASQSSDPDSELVGMASQQTADFLENDPDSHQAQISAWSSVLFNALDDTTRKRAAERIEDLGGRVDFLENSNVHIESNVSDSSDESDMGG